MRNHAILARNLPACHCAALTARAGETVFFTRFGIADTPGERFDLLLLHLWPVLERLRAWGGPDAGERAAQALIDELFSGLEASLRESGAGDLAVFRVLRRLAGDLSDRMRSYAAADGEAGLRAAIRRNLYPSGAAPTAGTFDGAASLARYVCNLRVSLVGWRPDEEDLDFGPLPE